MYYGNYQQERDTNYHLAGKGKMLPYLPPKKNEEIYTRPLLHCQSNTCMVTEEGKSREGKKREKRGGGGRYGNPKLEFESRLYPREILGPYPKLVKLPRFSHSTCDMQGQHVDEMVSMTEQQTANSKQQTATATATATTATANSKQQTANSEQQQQTANSKQ
jgi:hypothetical protein